MAMALELRAAGLVFVHNHPSGDPSPSKEDKKITRDLIWAAKLLSVQVLDHIIIGRGHYFSFADDGLIRRFTEDYEQKFRAL
jgi:DNA repair protein RadC